jgi:hypothetical protein
MAGFRADEEGFAIRLPDKMRCKKPAHLRHSADVSWSKDTITRAFSDACESAQELRGLEGPGIERLGLEEWRRMPGRSGKKIDGHVKFAASKQSDLRI